jgi:hypothetical protein
MTQSHISFGILIKAAWVATLIFITFESSSQCPTYLGPFGGTAYINTSHTISGTCNSLPNANYSQGAIGSDPILTVDGDLTIPGNFTIVDELVVNGTLTVLGTLTIDSDAILTINTGGTLDITGNLQNGGGLSFGGREPDGTSSGIITVGGDFNNNVGDFIVANGGVLDVEGAINENGGNITVEAGGTIAGNPIDPNVTNNDTTDPDCTNGCCGAQCSSEGDDVLPVELISIECKQVTSNTSMLVWSTATEIDNEGFEVEKSIDGKEFNSIGWVDGVGNSIVTENYKFTDYSFTYSAYYRLKQIDYDGTYEYHPVIKVKFVGENRVSFSPSLVTNQMTANGPIDTIVSGKVVDLSGNIVFIFDRKSIPELQTLLDRKIPALKSSTYIIQFCHSGTTNYFKFIKK